MVNDLLTKICDDNMSINAVDDWQPSVSHDSFICNLRNAQNFFFAKYRAGERNSWLLGDPGYPLELSSLFNVLHTSWFYFSHRKTISLASNFSEIFPIIISDTYCAEHHISDKKLFELNQT